MITEERFLRDVAKHEMTIVMDNGIHRNVVFKNPDGSNMWFGLQTWPNNLCFYGDMGTFVFSRLPDMFTFFRKGVDGDTIYINTRYWSEKITASDRNGGVEEFSFRSERDGLKFDMQDFYENNFMEYTPRFVWACYAIQWGIRKYDVEVAK